MATVCKHPRVRVVSRHEDTEFVECMECGEVFDSEEFQDMAIEESVEAEEAEAESCPSGPGGLTRAFPRRAGAVCRKVLRFAAHHPGIVQTGENCQSHRRIE